MIYIALIWFILVTLTIIIFYNRYNRKANFHVNETLRLPRGFFRVVLLITITALYIFVVATKMESYYLTSIENLLKYIIIFYFSTGVVKELKTKI